MIKQLTTYLLLLLVITGNAQLAITIPAEYEKNDRLLLVWPYQPEIDSVISEITAIARQATEVDIVYNPESVQFDTTQIRSFLLAIGVDSENVNLVPAKTNTFWLRQYAPITGYGVFTDVMVQYFGNPGLSANNRPEDDSIPSQLSSVYGKELAHYNLNFENNNIQYDGLRNLFVSDRILEQNLPMDENEIRFAINAYFNSDEVFFLQSLEQCGGGDLNSLDMYMKMLDFETIAFASIPDTLPDYENLEDIVEEISMIINYFGFKYKIIRIPSPPSANGYYPITMNEEFRSYTNSLILNNLVIVPSFGIPEFDSAAYHIYKKNMPGYIIYMVDARLLTSQHLGIHTITKEIPQDDYLRIIHRKESGPQSYIPDYHINCLAGAGEQVEEMWLYHKLNRDTSYIKTSIHLVCPQHFAKIEDLLPTDTVHYYIEAISTSTTTTYPLSAPEGNFTFWFDIVGEQEVGLNNNTLEIAPNPSSGSFRIIGNKSQKELKVQIYNTSGQIVMETTSLSGNFIHTNGLLQPGYYTVLISQDEYQGKLKLVIVK